MILSHHYSYKIIELRTETLEQIIINSERYRLFKEDFRLIKSISKNNLLFRYKLTGRIGQINVEIEKKENQIDIVVSETIFGFMVPLLLFIFSLASLLIEEYKLFVYVFCFFLFWLFLVVYFFFSDSKNIQERIKEYIIK